MPKKPEKKRWSKIVHPDGGRRIRIYEQAESAIIHHSVMVNGRKVRRSLGTGDRKEAVSRAEAIAIGLAASDGSLTPRANVTFGQVRRAYLANRGPLLSPARLGFMEKALGLFSAFLEPDRRPFPLDDFGQHHADAYLAARRSGRVRPGDRRAASGPRDGTLRNELQALSTACNWAVGYKVNGARLLTHNPVRDVTMPREKNEKRPVESPGRFDKLLRVSDQVDERGQFRAMLVLAWHTGRRVNAICHLRASDVLLGRDRVSTALAASGENESWASEWPNAIRWRAEHDKSGFENISPIGPTVVRELEAYLRRSPRLGDAWLFAMATDPERPQTNLGASCHLRHAEKLAGLSQIERGGWHAFRRAWATARKALPVQDVMAAGGWRDVQALQKAYQGADPVTTRQVVEFGERTG